LVDPDGWLPWREIRKVLCLAAGGGQQGPAFAALGCDVTVVDLSPGQLAIDRQVGKECGLTIRCIEGDMSVIPVPLGSRFDLVYHPISSCYVSDVDKVYRRVHELLRPGGWYRAEHWNPVHMRLWANALGDPTGYRLDICGAPEDPLVTTVSTGPAGEGLLESWTFPHSLSDLIGGLCDAGFFIRRLAEDCGGDPDAPIGSAERLAAFVPPFFRLLARRLPLEPAAMQNAPR
jgi:SAM-dependent methyltransferase